jgi:hypothetical protein
MFNDHRGWLWYYYEQEKATRESATFVRHQLQHGLQIKADTYVLDECATWL